MNIKELMRDYLKAFPQATVLPKMHILEDHVIPWMRWWKSEVMEKQGAEAYMPTSCI